MIADKMDINEKCPPIFRSSKRKVTGQWSNRREEIITHLQIMNAKIEISFKTFLIKTGDETPKKKTSPKTPGKQKSRATKGETLVILG